MAYPFRPGESFRNGTEYDSRLQRGIQVGDQRNRLLNRSFHLGWLASNVEKHHW
jgi:hypothetical protein